jgi:hypothetical protein
MGTKVKTKVEWVSIIDMATNDTITRYKTNFIPGVDDKIIIDSKLYVGVYRLLHLIDGKGHVLLYVKLKVDTEKKKRWFW